ncbi:hypothetical protein V8E53_006386 [Lactarius tabidus]
MAALEVLSLLHRHHLKYLILMGIKLHVCMLQSMLDFLEHSYDVHVLTDGVSSYNKEEVPLAEHYHIVVTF